IEKEEQERHPDTRHAEPDGHDLEQVEIVEIGDDGQVRPPHGIAHWHPLADLVRGIVGAYGSGDGYRDPAAGETDAGADEPLTIGLSEPGYDPLAELGKLGEVATTLEERVQTQAQAKGTEKTDAKS